MFFHGHHHGERGEGRGRHGHHWHAMRGRHGFGGGRHGGFTFWGEGRGDGRRQRLFDGGEFRLVLLRLIADEPRHGYDLIRAIEERTGGAYAPSPGVVYPTLTLLGDMDAIAESPTVGARKVFAATEVGRALLDEKAEEVEALMARLDALGSMRERTERTSVRRALTNFRSVLANKLGGHRFEEEALDEDTVHAIVALIDEVAQKIERL